MRSPPDETRNTRRSARRRAFLTRSAAKRSLASSATNLLMCAITTRSRMANKQSGSMKQSESVYRIIDVVGVSENSWEDAGRAAIETAAGSICAWPSWSQNGHTANAPALRGENCLGAPTQAPYLNESTTRVRNAVTFPFSKQIPFCDSVTAKAVSFSRRLEVALSVLATGEETLRLMAPSYGIHATPEPDKRKDRSHGCIRLTNGMRSTSPDGAQRHRGEIQDRDSTIALHQLVCI